MRSLVVVWIMTRMVLQQRSAGRLLEHLEPLEPELRARLLKIQMLLSECLSVLIARYSTN
jgi:hypothetical protein